MFRPLTHFARIRHRASDQTFGIRQQDRRSHIYIIGKTGTGKSTLIETLLMGDIHAGQGCALIDPHGDLVSRVERSLSSKQRARTVYVDLADPRCPYVFNPLFPADISLRPLIASALVDVFRMMWSDAWGTRMEHVLRNALFALLDQPAAALPDILRLLTDEAYRQAATKHIQNEQVRRFWTKEFPAYAARYRGDAIAPIQSKIGALLADPRLYRFFTQPGRPLRLRQLMDDGQIVIVNLSKGRLGADSARLAGAILTTMWSVAAFSRANIPIHRRRSFFLYIDEFQTFTTLALAEMLAELRKTKVALVMAHQYLYQLDPKIRAAVLGNAGTLIAFRLGAEDAAYFAREFEPKFSRLDFLNLPNHHIYLRLLIDGVPSKPFSATTLTPEQAAQAQAYMHS